MDLDIFGRMDLIPPSVLLQNNLDIRNINWIAWMICPTDGQRATFELGLVWKTMQLYASKLSNLYEKGHDQLFTLELPFVL